MEETKIKDIDPTQVLTEIEAIKNLKARYCRYVDIEDWEAFEDLFLPDALFYRGEGDDDIIRGRATFVQQIVASHTAAEARTIHHCHMPEIDVVDAATARGIWALFDYGDRIWYANGRREAYQGYGHYYEEYRKDDAGWRIASWRLVRIRIDVRSVGDAEPFPHRGSELTKPF